jgi:hypothetical protein
MRHKLFVDVIPGHVCCSVGATLVVAPLAVRKPGAAKDDYKGRPYAAALPERLMAQ